MITVGQPDSTKLEEVKQWEVWVKEPCTFEHDQQKTESFYILEGNAVLTTDANVKTEISSGDFVTVKSGQIVTWEISNQIKKHFRFYD